MVLHRVSADDAFELLVKASQERNVKLHEVAQQFVTSASEALARTLGPERSQSLPHPFLRPVDRP